MSKLTPLSRALLSAVLVAGSFFLIKICFKSGTGLSTTLQPNAILNLSGAATLGEKTMSRIAKEFMETELKGKDVKIEKTAEKEISIVGNVGGSEKRIVIKIAGSLAGLEDVKSQKADLAMLVSSPENLSSDIRLSNFGLDGLAMLVSKSNPVQTLSKKQITDIIQGNITNWVDVGGKNGLIKICIRDPKNASTFDSFKQLIENSSHTLSDNATPYQNESDMLRDIATDPNAIGLLSSTEARETKILALSDDGTEALYPNVQQ